MASPLPSTGPNCASSSASGRTSAPPAAAISALSSADPASVTRIWSISGARPWSRSTITPIVSATSRVGSTTVMVSRLCSSRRSSGNCEWWKDRINSCVLSHSVSRAPTTYPWEAVLEPGRDEELVASSREREQAGLAEPIPDDLHPALLEGLAAAGIEALWAHQAKALAQDQARGLARIGGKYLRHAIYDGDTPREERRAIRQRSNLILTNPDMLHVGVLPNHRQWGDLLANLAWVVVDEAHVYRGVFGSHVANVLRRLRRLARAYGSEPRFLLTSATIANPTELAQRLTGVEVELVDRDGAPRAERQIAMWNPPLVDERLGRRTSALGEAAELLASLVEREIRTICFLKSRRGVELIQRFARQRLEDAGRADLAERIAPYRAGYTPMQRRGERTPLSVGR